MDDVECPAFLDLFHGAAPSKTRWTLDLGAGRGRPISSSPPRGWLSFDLRRRALRQAAENAQAESCAFHQGDAHRLPYRDDAFTAVVSNALLHHVQRPEQVLAEAVRVLAPGGLLLFRDLLPGASRGCAAAAKWPCRLPSFGEIAERVAELGFPATSVRPMGRHWVWLAYKPRSDKPAV